MRFGRSALRGVFTFIAAMSLTGADAAMAAPAVSGAQGARAQDKAGDKAAGALASHRVTYDMSLAKVSNSDGVRAASGTMTYTITDRCDGYTIETNLSMDLAFANGDDNQVEQRYASWEAKDGKSSTFRLQVAENGKIAKAYHGDIHFNDDGTGVATYEGDEITKFDLPRGTLLSTAHTQALIDSAAAKKAFLSKLVIDGSFDDGPFWVTAVIGSQQKSSASPVKSGADTRETYWPVGIAYFPMASKEELPEYEIKQHLTSTGITHDMTQDFGGFTLAFKAVKVEPVTAPACS
jgi:hypothetical protein